MSSRYTKSIPSEVYFVKESNGWYGGPYVNPPKGKQQVIICKIMEITVGKPKKKSNTLDNISNMAEREQFAEEHKGSFPADIPSKEELKQSQDLRHLAEWLKSAEGKLKIKEAQEQAEKDSKIIDKLRDIDPKILREPFNI